jgi:glycosyltransferase involved in cell wall biosynthesis
VLPLTLAIVARDEADRIGRAIASVPGAAEVLVLDSGSTDATVAVAEAAGARVVHTDWPGYGAQKNRAMKMAGQPWVLFLDADEWLDADLLAAVARVLEDPAGGVGFSVRRRNRYLGRSVRGGCFGPSWKVRLVRTGAGCWKGGMLHESLVCSGPTHRLKGLLEHDPFRNELDWAQTGRHYAALFARQGLEQGRVAHAWDLLLRPPLHFVKSILLRAGFRDGMLGLRLAFWGARDVAWKWQALRNARTNAVLPPLGMVPASTKREPVRREAEEGSG